MTTSPSPAENCLPRFDMVHERILEFFSNLAGLGVDLRGIIIFLVTLATVRLGHKRSLSRKTQFDAVLLVIFAAVLSRAINGSAAFFATLGGGVVLVVLHRLSLFSHSISIGLESWSKAGLMSLCAMNNAMYP
jgi:hypothetical protein